MGILSFFFEVVAYVFNLFIPFWLLESSTDGKGKRVRERKEFSDSFSPFQDFETRTSFHESYSYGRNVPRDLTEMTVARDKFVGCFFCVCFCFFPQTVERGPF